MTRQKGRRSSEEHNGFQDISHREKIDKKTYQLWRSIIDSSNDQQLYLSKIERSIITLFRDRAIDNINNIRHRSGYKEK